MIGKVLLRAFGLEGKERGDGTTCEPSTNCAIAGSSDFTDRWTMFFLTKSPGVKIDGPSIPLYPEYASEHEVRQEQEEHRQDGRCDKCPAHCESKSSDKKSSIIKSDEGAGKANPALTVKRVKRRPV
jgi:hypothetical protein